MIELFATYPTRGSAHGCPGGMVILWAYVGIVVAVQMCAVYFMYPGVLEPLGPNFPFSQVALAVENAVICAFCSDWRMQQFDQFLRTMVLHSMAQILQLPQLVAADIYHWTPNSGVDSWLTNTANSELKAGTNWSRIGNSI